MTLKGAVLCIITLMPITASFLHKLRLESEDMCIYKGNIIDCSGNQFQQLPSGLDLNVTQLDLSNNEFETIPQDLNNYGNLVFLNLSHNKIHSMRWNDFEGLKKLEKLDLSYNFFTDWKDIQSQAFTSIQSLKYLDLSHNALRRIPGDKLNIKSLTTLRLNHCSMTNLSSTIFENLPNLVELSVSDNNLATIPNGNLLNLHRAEFRGNNFKAITNNSFQNMKKLRFLDMSNNALSRIEINAFSSLSDIQDIDLSRNTLSHISTDLFTYNKQLRSLKLSRNYFNSLPTITSDSLETLDLSICEIASINRDALIDIPKLKTLILSKNTISVLPDYLNADELESLDVSLCRIIGINNRTFAGMSSLHRLNLAGNRLTTASPESLSQVILLDISDNPWRCDCQQLKPLFDWLLRTGKDTENLYCQSPEPHEGNSWLGACRPEWYPDFDRGGTVWWYTTGIIVSLFLVLFLILALRRVYLQKEKRIRQANETRRAEERETLRRMQRMQAEAREEANRNAPDPRELQRPPSYNEAVSLPRLDSSHPSLLGSLHSVASKQSINGSTSDVNKRSRPRRKRRRRRSDSSEGQRASRVVVESDTSDQERSEPRPTLESDF